MAKSPLLGALAVILAAAPAVEATIDRPALRLVDRSPVIVTGRGFDAQEVVRVRLAAAGQVSTRRATANANGTFRVRFATSLDVCTSLSLQAFGSAGSRARLFRRAALPDCDPND